MEVVKKQDVIDLLKSGMIDGESSLVCDADECNSMLEWAVEEVTKMTPHHIWENWIDAYEETPKTYTEKPGFDISDAVLVYGKDGYFIANFVEYLDDHDQYANGFRSCEDPTNWVDVEYWMPLPEEP